MQTTTVKALKDLYVSKGGSLLDVNNITTIPDMILKLTALDIVNNVVVESAPYDEEVFGYTVATLQSNITVINETGNICGKSEKQSEALWSSGPLAGTGHFIALKFNDNLVCDSIKVGLNPSQSDIGMLELDNDRIAVFKLITPNVGTLSTQKLKVECTKNGVKVTKIYNFESLEFES